MTKRIRSLVVAFVGLLLGLTWLVVRQRRVVQVADQLPAKVWHAGAGAVTVEVETTAPSTVTAVFETRGPESEPRLLEARQRVPAGRHRFSIEVPANVGGSVVARIDQPTLGDKVALALSAPGGAGGRNDTELAQPLHEGETVAAVLEIEDYASAALEE